MGPCNQQSAITPKGTSKCMLVTSSNQLDRRSGSPWSNLERLVQNFWDQEAIGLIDKPKTFTQEERSAVEQFNDSVSFDGTRYTVSLPFKVDAPDLVSNYDEQQFDFCQLKGH